MSFYCSKRIDYYEVCYRKNVFIQLGYSKQLVFRTIFLSVCVPLLLRTVYPSSCRIHYTTKKRFYLVARYQFEVPRFKFSRTIEFDRLWKDNTDRNWIQLVSWLQKSRRFHFVFRWHFVNIQGVRIFVSCLRNPSSGFATKKYLNLSFFPKTRTFHNWLHNLVIFVKTPINSGFSKRAIVHCIVNFYM